ncbi:VENN motif pre-toxin domain-containing protein [Gilliamella sp. B2838]|uniref:VENN motif pre-toxin domain-containing protein n=1 Tax=Gilliamella sp. B2838 TaxID=2818020 RepID=UPI0022699255|nr:VENN motif pre-toxin domain-containing protein [Gilliamella sp. B2838]MCX8728672.1 VENN motif pre-toxin domain-containing protein [Gilliamella sp. B2838]
MISRLVAELQGNSGLVGGAGAVGGELAAQVIRKTFYGDKNDNELTEAEKQNISALAQLATGLAIAVAGGDVGDAGTAIAAGKNSVENNFMALQVMDEFDRDYRDGLLLFKGDEKAATDYANEMIRDRAIASGVVTGVIVGGIILPNSAIIGGSLNGAINAGMQYTLNDDGSINWTDVGIASGVGVVTGGAGTGFWGTIGWNATGGATSNYLKDEEPLIGAAAGAIGSGFGYLGGKMLQGSLEKMFNPISKQYEWVPIGIWTITKPASHSSIPAISGGVVGSATGELIQKNINDLMKSKKDEEK